MTGSGRVAGTPDVLRLDIGVSVTKPTVTAALDAANSAAAAVQKSLADSGVADADVQTSGLSIQTDYDYNGNTPKLRGYQVSESVTARLRDLDKAGAAISAAATAGGDATRINSAGLDLENSSDLLVAARDRAVAEARTKAEQYAKAVGRSLGPVVSITEQTTSPGPSPMADRAVAMSASASPVPIAVGSQEISVDVTVVWSFA